MSGTQGEGESSLHTVKHAIFTSSIGGCMKSAGETNGFIESLHADRWPNADVPLGVD
jgi:hypothetical protein